MMILMMLPHIDLAVIVKMAEILAVIVTVIATVIATGGVIYHHPS
jgi:hypothetical protein